MKDLHGHITHPRALQLFI